MNECVNCGHDEITISCPECQSPNKVNPDTIPHMRISVGTFHPERTDVAISVHNADGKHYLAIIPPEVAWAALSRVLEWKGENNPNYLYIPLHEITKSVETQNEVLENLSWAWIVTELEDNHE